MPGSFRLGKIAGIEIDLNISWIVIIVLLTISLATGWFRQLYPGWSTATYWITSFIGPNWLLLVVEGVFVVPLFIAFTGATALSPADTYPLTRLAKALMMIEAIISLALIGILVARAVNILGS